MQQNGWDCGVFLLQYYEHLISRLLASPPTLAMTKGKVRAKFKPDDFSDWFDQTDILALRTMMRELVHNLARERDALAARPLSSSPDKRSKTLAATTTTTTTTPRTMPPRTTPVFLSRRRPKFQSSVPISGLFKPGGI